MAARDLSERYGAFYRTRDPRRLYPVEFVVRAFLGRYPRLDTAAESYAGQRVLDLGFGDGVEITEEICTRAVSRLARLGVAVEARVGRNDAIPFEDEFFDQVLACHSCYYVAPETTFNDNVREIARVMKLHGRFVFSAPIGTSYILREARDLGDGHMQVTADPYGVRNGSVLKKFDAEADIRRALSPLFDDLRIGSCRNDFWGIDEHVWIVVCRRAA
jgi:SAM-dependent methyltransferase